MSIEEFMGSLKAHEERLHEKSKTPHGQLLFIEEDWKKRERSDGKLLMTREEWLKKTNREGNRGGTDLKGRDGIRGSRDRSK